ncbi:MarR family transcriptional regulator [Novosphingobium sp. BL-52-GroH]|uniref:MarR family transcriptional regulator n=1 Tax=Novosphingobium sp. BL-52-GroH TaxID=3349877 RepID=UPI0038516317
MKKSDGQQAPPMRVADAAVRRRVQHTLYKLLELDSDMRAEFGSSLLSHDFRLILQATVSESLIVKDASASSLLSGRAFHQLLKRLETVGLIRFELNAHDRRSKSIAVDEGLVAHLYDNLGD